MERIIKIYMIISTKCKNINSLIPDDLKAAKRSWNDIHKDAEFISKDIAFKQEKTN